MLTEDFERLHRPTCGFTRSPPSIGGGSCGSRASSWACRRSPGYPRMRTTVFWSKGNGSFHHGTAGSSRRITWPIRSSAGSVRVCSSSQRDAGEVPGWGHVSPRSGTCWPYLSLRRRSWDGCWCLTRGESPAESRATTGSIAPAAQRGDHGESGRSPILPFRRSDAAILMPFATLLGLHVRASQRYLYINDVLVGLTRLR